MESNNQQSDSEFKASDDNRNSKVIAAFVLILAVVIIAGGVALFGRKEPAEETASNQSAQSNGQTSAATDSSADSDTSNKAAELTDGTYSADGSYMTPGGQESIGVTVTLKDGVVTDTSLQQTAENGQTKEYQDKFASGYKQLVVGKKIGDIKVSKVSGSSLTSQGFQDALQDIEAQAQANV